MRTSELRKRWDTAEGRAFAAEISEWLHGRARLPRSLATVDGRGDLRGFAIHHLQSRRPSIAHGTVENARWVELDLRGSSLDHLRWSSVEVVGCLFDGASLNGLRVWESSIEHTSFVGAKLVQAVLRRLEEDDSMWSRQLAAILDGALVKNSAEDSSGFFIRDDFVRWESEGFATFVFDHFHSASLAIASEGR